MKSKDTLRKHSAVIRSRRNSKHCWVSLVLTGYRHLIQNREVPRPININNHYIIIALVPPQAAVPRDTYLHLDRYKKTHALTPALPHASVCSYTRHSEDCTCYPQQKIAQTPIVGIERPPLRGVDRVALAGGLRATCTGVILCT